MLDQHMTDAAASAKRCTSIAVALTIMLLAQAALALASPTVPVMEIPVAADTGLPVVWVGFYSATITSGAMVAAILGAPLVDRLGPIRSSQSMLMAAAGGLLLHPLGSTVSFVLGALLIGCGYGPANSAGSNLLRRVVPPHRRSLLFSVKQISIPLGGAVAGMLVPVVAASLTWKAAAISVALVCCGLAVAI
jgi:MFS family permease